MQTLREIQAKQIQRAKDAALREASRASGYPAEQIDQLWQHAQFSVKRLREANSETSFPQLLRAGVNSTLFGSYEQVPVVYPDLVTVNNSDKFEELYAPLYGAEVVKEVREQQQFEDSRLQGLDVRLPNRKFGRMLTIARELVDDDQTGQIVQKAATMGERVRYVEEQTVMNAIMSAQYTSSLYGPGSGNVTASGSFGQLSQPLLEQADIALETATDPLGNLIMVAPDTLLVSPADKFNAAKLLQSTLQPSVPGQAGQTANTATSGGTGFTMTVNPLQGLYSLKVGRFLPKAGGLDGTHGAAILLQAKKSVIFQDRDPLEVAQETANSGSGFERDVYRFRVRRRFNAGVLDSRWLYRIN